MSSADPTLDELLARLAEAQSRGASDDELSPIRKQITLAGDREAAARQAAREAESPRTGAPGARLATAAPYTPNYTPTPEIQSLLDRLRAALAQSDLAEHADLLLSRAEPCVLLSLAEHPHDANPELPLGASRFGFVPDLPPDLPWPAHDGRKLPFLAQLDLSTFPTWPGSPLPATGWLYAFFHFPIQITPDDPWRYLILYHDGPRDALARQPRLERNDEDDEFNGPYDLVTLRPRLGIDVDPQLLLSGLDAADRGALKDLLESVTRFSNDSYADTGFAGHLLGQTYDFGDETVTDTLNSLIRTGLHPVPLRLARQPDGPGDDWIHLFSLRSVGSMMWCDAGFIYFLIRRSDLAARNFQNVVLSFCTS